MYRGSPDALALSDDLHNTNDSLMTGGAGESFAGKRRGSPVPGAGESGIRNGRRARIGFSPPGFWQSGTASDSCEPGTSMAQTDSIESIVPRDDR